MCFRLVKFAVATGLKTLPVTVVVMVAECL